MFQCGRKYFCPMAPDATALGSIEGSTAWQAFKWGVRPYLGVSNLGNCFFFFFSRQSTSAFVTQRWGIVADAPTAGLQGRSFRHARMADVSKIVETMRPLRVLPDRQMANLMMRRGHQLAMFNGAADIRPIRARSRRVAQESSKAIGMACGTPISRFYGTDGTVAASRADHFARRNRVRAAAKLLTRPRLAATRGSISTKTLIGRRPQSRTKLACWRLARGNGRWPKPGFFATGGSGQKGQGKKPEGQGTQARAVKNPR